MTQSPQSVSPTPKKDILPSINFFDALKEVTAGKKIRRQEWPEGYYGYLSVGVLTLRKPDNKDYSWIVNDGDLAGVDWIVLS